MDKGKVRVATADDEAAAVSVIALAFSTDPMVRWTFRDPAVFWRVMPDFVRAFGGGAFEHESAYVIGEAAGAALWLPPGTESDGARLSAIIEHEGSAEAARDGGAVLEKMSRFHPKEPCWYLPLIGIDPTQQGRGLGALLMRSALERFDREGVPAYLESSNPRNISLYQRLGFQELGEVQHGSSPTVVPMFRPVSYRP
jgi:ribosomal protein S18 acetylase RimI-like enzyme